MHKLFIIGNGFDCYGHCNKKRKGMKTKYEDFKEYILYRYPDIIYNNGVPEQHLTADHHGYEYDEDEVVGYIVRILDCCEDDKWSTLENSLGSSIYSAFDEDFLYIDLYNEKDSEISRCITANEHMGSSIARTFILLKDLFDDWVNSELKNIPYKSYKKHRNYKKVLVGNPLIDRLKGIKRTYINFNYTSTLEKIYKIDSCKVFHLHGKSGEEVLFGHGNNDEDLELYPNWGAEDYLNYIRRYFLKDTQSVISNNRSLFKSLEDVKEIYSYGFSFSDVDMVYIDEICRYVTPQNVTWFFNKFDSENNKSYLNKIRDKGFYIKTEYRW